MNVDDVVGTRLGLGCGRLKGGGDKKSSIALVRAAVDVGIRHFDVAPSYGLGGAEQVLGEALTYCNMPITVTTKVGIPRPASPSMLQVARTVVKPVSRFIPGLRSAALGVLASRSPQKNFDADFIQQSIHESLTMLQLPQLDFLLLHEPTSDLDFPKIARVLDSLVEDGVIGAYGSSTGDEASRLIPFGTVAQYQCLRLGSTRTRHVPVEITHGAFRVVVPALANLIDRDQSLLPSIEGLAPSGWSRDDGLGAVALAYVLTRSPAMLLISTNEPNRLKRTIAILRQVLQSENWLPLADAIDAASTRARASAGRA